MKGRQWLLAVGAVGALFALTATWQRGGRGTAPAPGAAQAQAVSPADTFRLVWSEPIPDLRSASLSADGQSVVTVSAQGQVRLWDWAHRPERPLWSRPLPGVSRSEVGTGHHAILAYAALDPTRPTLFLLGDGGRLIGRSTLDGAVWATALSPDGTRAGVTTGSGSLYLYTLGPHPTLHRQRLDGIGDSVSLSPDDGLTVGTWDDSGVGCYTAQGSPQWQYPATPEARAALTDRLFETHMARDGRAVLGLSYGNVRGGDAALYYWRGVGGRPAWRCPLPEDAYFPQAGISANGMCVAASYTQMVTHGEQSLAERRLVMLDAEGETLWEKGGLLFAPTLVSIAADGHRVTVSDGRQTLYHLDDTGRITTPYVFRAPFSSTIKPVGTADGRWLLVYTEDGLLNLVRMD